MVPCFYIFLSFEQSSHLTLWSWPWPMIPFVSSRTLFLHSVLWAFTKKKLTDTNIASVLEIWYIFQMFSCVPKFRACTTNQTSENFIQHLLLDKEHHRDMSVLNQCADNFNPSKIWFGSYLCANSPIQWSRLLSSLKIVQ
jgi:hypothetical protein